MKTIKEAAEEYAKSYAPVLFEDLAPSYFMAGVEFAQRWIPVSEELPTKQDHYFVKAPKSFPKNCIVVVAEFYEDNKMFYSESSDCPLPDVTHWRPIELH